MRYGPDAVKHIVTSLVNKAGVVTQIFVLSLPLNILRQQYRTGMSAQLAINAAATSRDLASIPRVIVQIMPELREVTAVATPGTVPVRYRIPYGVLVPWESLIFKISFREAVPIIVPEGAFVIEERNTCTIRKLMHRLYLKIGNLILFKPAVPVSLPDSSSAPCRTSRIRTPLIQKNSGKGFSSCRRVCSSTESLPTLSKE